MLEVAEQQRTKILKNLFSDYAGPVFAIQLWDGWCWRSSEAKAPACTMEILTPEALQLLIANPNESGMGEAYVHGDIDVKGDLFSVFSMVEYIVTRPTTVQQELSQRIAAGLLDLRNRFRKGARHSLARDRSVIADHYDQPFEFYRSWLGKTLTYSCAYFRDVNETLDQAQENKMDLICRKLRLEPFETFLDIGCGWGSLILHATKKYSAYSHGITLSKEQARIAAERIQNDQLSYCCQVEFRDYRTLQNVPVPFDKIASVGMFEHIELDNLPQYFRTVWRALKPGGVFLNHGIARAHHSLPKKSSFMDQYVFPDARLVTLSQALSAAEVAGFEVRDVENLREHYAATLRLWVRDLQRHETEVLEHVSPHTYRTWILYMAGCSEAFRRGDLGVYQMLLSRPERGNSSLPLTREDWYVPSNGKEEAGRFQRSSDAEMEL